eukprot:TRINITY_DN3050_c0_g1_i5.p1 TRINITY_DN3050_c0_g1~~TRINITY_DN3050_c0_g1_i5.p1  ORF type:complete len:142 (-),score=33.35 TRINITY_DN3050_c0_g1_i5:196-621(-)
MCIRDRNKDISRMIARKFNESNREQIRKVVEAMGDEKALEFVSESIAVQKSGGATLEDGHNRTLGGVFFRLVKDHLRKEDLMLMKIVFEREAFQRRKRNIMKSKRRKERKRQLKIAMLAQANNVETKEVIAIIENSIIPTE